MISLIRRFLSSTEACLALTFTGLILFLPANLLPFISIEMYGRKNVSTLWESVIALYHSGSILIALVVLVASIIIPFAKLLILLYLLSANYRDNVGEGERKLQRKIYHYLEGIGRWSMLDIFIVAIMVAVFKFGKWTTVKVELGAILFSIVVVLTMIATASYRQVRVRQ